MPSTPCVFQGREEPDLHQSLHTSGRTLAPSNSFECCRDTLCSLPFQSDAPHPKRYECRFCDGRPDPHGSLPFGSRRPRAPAPTPLAPAVQLPRLRRSLDLSFSPPVLWILTCRSRPVPSAGACHRSSNTCHPAALKHKSFGRAPRPPSAFRLEQLWSPDTPPLQTQRTRLLT